MLNFINKIFSRFQFKGQFRSINTKKNIALLFVFNGFNFIFNLIIVRLTLDYLGKAEYGIWLTLSAVLTWFSYLDFGLGNGLRNKLTEALTKNDISKAKIYVSTTYAVFSLAIFLVIIIFLLIYRFINWISIFQAPAYLNHEIQILILFAFIFFLVQYVLRLLSFIVTADQKPAINGFFSFSINLLTVVFIYLLLRLSKPSIVFLGIGSTLMPVVVFLAASFILFGKKYKQFSPSYKFVKLIYLKDLAGLGIKFFIIQAATLIVLATDNMIITQLFGPGEVTIYNIAFKYFNYIPIIFYVLLTPLWSAYTEAYLLEDFQWIKNAINKILKIWVLLCILVIIMILIANRMYVIWLNSKIEVPLLLTILMGLFAIVSNWNNIFAYFLNGVGKIRISLYYSVFIGIINIPLSVIFAKNFNMGISGVIAATLVCLLIGSVWAPIQYYKIINKKDSGIWSK